MLFGSYIGMKVANITVKIHYSRNKLLIFSAIFVTCTFIQLVLTTEENVGCLCHRPQVSHTLTDCESIH